MRRRRQMEIGIDTSTALAGIAISHEGQALYQLSWSGPQSHTQALYPNLVHLMAQAGLRWEGVTALYVALGPGSFNGLRVGLSAAKGLAYARQLPMLGICTLELETYPHAWTGLPLCALQEVGGGMLAAACYRMEGVEWRCLKSPHLTGQAGVALWGRRRTLFCGSGAVALASVLEERLGSRALVAQGPISSRGAALAALGWRRLSRGERDDPATLQPIYLRRPSITLRGQKPR